MTSSAARAGPGAGGVPDPEYDRQRHRDPLCVLSYAGTLPITILSDPSRVPDVVLAAIRICPLTATRLALSLSQSVSGSRYRPPWVCYRYGCELMQPGAGPGKRGAC